MGLRKQELPVWSLQILLVLALASMQASNARLDHNMWWFDFPHGPAINWSQLGLAEKKHG